VTAMAGRGRTWALLGAMGELGASSVAEHDLLGRYAVRLNVGTLVAIGEEARPIAQGAALEGSYDAESQWVADLDAAAALVAPQLRPGDVVLVKASRAAGLERLAQRLATSAEPPLPGGPEARTATGMEWSAAMDDDGNAQGTTGVGQGTRA
jgi:UDP-N-acetylmuramoyl-tripeptide--D-alanyl-D-alanine ligase